MSHRVDTRPMRHEDTAPRLPPAPLAAPARASAAARSPAAMDVRGLFDALSAAIEGEVRFDDGTRAAYAHDASHYRQAPIGVVVPRHEQDVIEAVRIAREHDAPVVARGGGTSLAGQCCNAAVVIDFTKYMNDVLEVDAERRIARVQPGCVLDDLRAEAAPHGLTFGPDPATHNHCTLGGMIGNDSCGIHSVMAEQFGPGPRTVHQVVSLRVLTYDGEVLEVGALDDDALQRAIDEGGRRGEVHRALRDLRDRHADAIRARFPDIPRRVSGYNLPALLPENGFDVAQALVGSESTCVVILEATVRLMWQPECRSLVVLGFDDAPAAGDHVVRVMEHRPIGLEGMDRALIADVRYSGLHADYLDLLPDGNGFLLVEFGADTQDEADDMARRLCDDIDGVGGLRGVRRFEDPDEAHHIWQIRESGLGATAWVPGRPPTWPGWEDAAVPPAAVGDYLRDFAELLDRYDYVGDLYGHFGQGCIHTRISFDHRSAEGIDRYRRFIDEAADLVVRHGGSLSGEHGDGQSRGALLEKMYGPELMDAFRAFKRIWDPRGRMNPGKLIDAYAPTENLHLGTDFAPPVVDTHFHYGNDHGGFTGATLRCVGVGECRRDEGGVMCPSYRATREEIHSTRGRARILFEMMRGEVVTDGWRSEEVHDALDLCLACKGCKSDCPVDVDMATYKAEFAAHHWKGRLRPRHAYAFGLIPWAARAASIAPGLVNWLTHGPTAPIAKWLAGASPHRDLPRFADQTFTRWFARNRPGQATHTSVPQAPRPTPQARLILWPDTFNDHFHPQTARAAVEVLEGAGFDVVVPHTWLCCGRPLYDYGFLGLARRQLRRILEELAPEIRAGTPVVGLEPSCVATLRDELLMLFPHDEDAHRLAKQTFLLGEFLEQNDVALPHVDTSAIVHAHCHHHSVLDWDAETRVLDRMGLDWSRPEESCCGMAGAFGFEKEKYDLSLNIADRRLLPAVRDADRDTLLLANGFSCREQIRQTTGRMPLHLAELIARATR